VKIKTILTILFATASLGIYACETLTTQTVTITGDYSVSTDSNGNKTLTFPDGVVLFDRGEPIPIIVVGMKATGPNISLQSNPNHVAITVTGSGTSDVKITCADWTAEATGVVTTTSGF